MPGKYGWTKTKWEKVKGPLKNESVKELDQNKKSY